MRPERAILPAIGVEKIPDVGWSLGTVVLSDTLIRVMRYTQIHDVVSDSGGVPAEGSAMIEKGSWRTLLACIETCALLIVIPCTCILLS